jgi:hypothetical protein
LRRGVFAQFSTRNPGFKLPKQRISRFTGAAIADKRLRGSDWDGKRQKTFCGVGGEQAGLRHSAEMTGEGFAETGGFEMDGDAAPNHRPKSNFLEKQAYLISGAVSRPRRGLSHHENPADRWTN